jgi:hypothetical protein
MPSLLPTLAIAVPVRAYLGRTAGERAAADAVLGSEHPLVRLLGASQTTIERMLVVAAVQALGAGLLVEHSLIGLAALIAASLVQGALAFRLLILVETRHDLCRELVIHEPPTRGVATVERECRRLSDSRHRARLSSSLERLAETAERPSPRVPGSRPYFSLRVVRPIVPELRELAELIRNETSAVAGVALVERLLTSPASPLYGTDAHTLREQLARARYRLLADR